MSTQDTLTLIWAGLIAFAVFAYVCLDGFDLGIGILFPLLGDDADRTMSMNAIAPVWDGNETWLVFGGGGLMAAFPLAYAILMPAVYPPLIAMLLGLVFRGVAFEYRWRTRRGRWVWDVAFFGGSTLAALCQGVILGTILQGIVVSGRGYGGGLLDWLTPFTALTGVSVVVGYGLLGATWLILKTQDGLLDRAFRLAWIFGAATLAALSAVSVATLFLRGDYLRRWLAFPGVLGTAQVPLLVTIVSAILIWALVRRKETWPFPMALALFALGYAGLAVSLYPDILPGRVTLQQASAPVSTLSFMLAGAVVLIPMILSYTGYAYWVFRGKTGAEGYH
jgi:cytochrome bd ubiquinol oxidase subunit II